MEVCLAIQKTEDPDWRTKIPRVVVGQPSPTPQSVPHLRPHAAEELLFFKKSPS